MAKSNAARQTEVDRTEKQPARKRKASSAIDLDAVIHERVRLSIVSALAVNEKLSFNELKKLLDTSDGNLSVHARKLEDAGYIVCQKSFSDRKPRTEYKLSAAGKRALEKYLDHMDALIRRTKGG